MLLNQSEPLEYGVLELLIGLALWLVFYIEHGRKVAILKINGLDEVIGLLLGWSVNAVEVIGTTGKSVLASLIEIVAEVTVGLCCSLGGLDHYEAYGTMIDGAIVLKLVPIDLALMVGDVDAVNLIALRIAYVAIQCAPTEAERANKEIVEEI